MKSIFLLLLLFIFPGCFLFGPTRQKSKILYNEKITDDESIKIIYSNISYSKSFSVLLKEKSKLIDRFEITDIPERFVIDKLILSEKGSRRLYRLISDTSNSQLKCIEFNFPENFNNKGTLETLVLISPKEKQIFTIFSDVLIKNDIGLKLSESEIEKFIGWVEIHF